MKLKIANSLFIAALLVAGAGCFSSCKDTDEDMRAQLENQISSSTQVTNDLNNKLTQLQGDLNTLRGLYDQLKAQCDACKEACKQEMIAYVDAKVSGLASQADLDALAEALRIHIGAYDALKTQVEGLAGDITRIESLLDLKADKTEVTQKFTEINTEILSIQGRLDALEALAGQLGTLGDTLAGLTSQLEALGQQLGQLGQSVSELESNVNGLTTNVNNILNETLPDLQNKYNDLDTQLGQVVTKAQEAYDKASTNAGEIDALKGLIQDLTDRLDGMTPGTGGSGLTEDQVKAIVQDMLNAPLADIEQLKLDVDAAKQEAANNLAEAKTALQNQIDALVNRIGAVEGEVANINLTIGDIQEAVNGLDIALGNLNRQVEENTILISNQQYLINNLTKVVTDLVNRISSVIIQEVSTPIFGSISLPLDVRSLVLFNYFGVVNHEVIAFPDFRGFDYNYGLEAQEGVGLLSAAKQQLLGFTPVTPAISTGETFFANEGEGNFGSIYLTINPANIDLTGKSWELVNSRGEKYPIAISTPRKSNRLITFGYSRAEDAPSLYVADATLNVGNVPEVQINIEPGMKAALKQAWDNKTLGNFAEVAKLVYKSVNNVPALGVKASWEEDGKTQTVYSQYGMGAATFCPLSYSTFYGKDLSNRLPKLPDIDRLLDRFNFDFDKYKDKLHFEFTFDGFSDLAVDVQIPSFNIDLDIDLSEINTEIPVDNVKVEIPKYKAEVVYKVDPLTGLETGEVDHVNIVVVPVDDPDYGEPSYAYASGSITIEDFVIEFADALKESVDQAVQQSFDNFTSEMKANIDSAINNMVANLTAQMTDFLNSLSNDINSQLGSVLDELQQDIDGKIESVTNRIRDYYTRIENAYNRMLRFFKNPNHYLQVALLYSDGNSMGRLSNTPALPSRWAGNGTAATLVPTTYNVELITPAYKKFVAVTNVYTADGKSAVNGDAKCLELLKAANNPAFFMNTVVSGERHTIAFNFAGARNQGGKYTYEIFYQALDFRGNTSTQKFYVTIL